MNNTNFLSVNDLFKEDISKITAADIPLCVQYLDKETRIKLCRLEEIINSIGLMSTKAQGLKRTLTTFEKLRLSPDHKLYILKDGKSNEGAGEVIGILKTGVKQLYLYDLQSKLVIASPVCILDFFVVDCKQRRGFGKKLYDYMLEDQKLKPHELAIDGPSPKMLEFLKKHYNFTKVLKYSNNFAVCDKFFESTNIGKTQDGTMPTHSASRRISEYGASGEVHRNNVYRIPSHKGQTMAPKVKPISGLSLKKWSSEAGALIHGGRTSPSYLS